MERSATTNFFDFSAVQHVLVNHHPALCSACWFGCSLRAMSHKMLASVKEIDNLNGAGEVQIGKVPDPFGPIADYDFVFSPAPTAPPGFRIKPLAKLFGGFNRADVGSRIGIADRVALLVPSRFA